MAANRETVLRVRKEMRKRIGSLYEGTDGKIEIEFDEKVQERWVDLFRRMIQHMAEELAGQATNCQRDSDVLQARLDAMGKTGVQ